MKRSMDMRTLILSDLHLGNGGDYDVFAGSEALPALLERFVDPPTRVILNGDSMDFLMNEDPLKLDVNRAVEQAEDIATAKPTAPTLEALGRICKAGGEVLVRMGNHDVELALAEVRDVFRKRLKQPNSVAQRLTFERGSAPHIMTVGGAKILITHGEQDDPFNRVDYEHLPGPGASGLAQAKDFEYPAGSLLVKEILNPLKRKRNMRFADLLKPDFQGAVLTALAVDPLAVKVALKGESLEIIRRALQNLGEVSFESGADKLGMTFRLQGAGLTLEEIEALQQQLTGEPDEVSFGLMDDLLYGIRLKLTKAGLKLYAHAQRRLADDSGAQYFSYKPGEDEWEEAKRLSKKFDAKAVILGHSHAARWKQDNNLLYTNTGTWIWLMRLPDESASDDEWMEFLQDLKDDPKLKKPKNQAKIEKRFTPVTVEPKSGGGATVTLHIWEPSGELSIVHSATVSQESAVMQRNGDQELRRKAQIPLQPRQAKTRIKSTPTTMPPTKEVKPEVKPPPTTTAGPPSNTVQEGAKTVGRERETIILQRYLPPPPANKVTLEVYSKTVVLRYSDVVYTGPNRLDFLALRADLNRYDYRGYGEQLFNGIIHNGISEDGTAETTTLQGYGAAIRATKDQVRFELILDQNDTEINQLRWEYLKQPDKTPLAVLGGSAFYRRLNVRTEPLSIEKRPIKVLVAICSPNDLGPEGGSTNEILQKLVKIDVSAERERMEKALEWASSHGMMQYDIFPNANVPAVTLEALRKALQDGYHVLHLLCHGLFIERKRNQRQFYLVMERTDRQSHFVLADDFIDALRLGKGMLRLVILAACQSAISSTGAAFHGLGPRLAREAGIPSVIGMQDLLPVPAAQLFTQHFYDDLARSGRIDMALAVTRLSLYQPVDQKSRAETGSWGIPVLLMCTDDGKLLDPAELPEREPEILPFELPAGQNDLAPELPLQDLSPPPSSTSQLLSSLSLMMNRVMEATPPRAEAVVLAPQQPRGALTTSLQRPVRISVEDRLGPPRKEGLKTFVEKNEKGGLRLPPSVYAQIASALNTGKHIILIGPPGTGKTSLAKAICEYAQSTDCRFSAGITYATATADWTTFDTVGGYVPTAQQTLQFRPGIFLRAICDGHWLVIDEINRAEIDKAFGELFTVLSGQRVDLPYRVGDIPVRVLPPAHNGQDGWIPLEAKTGFDYVVHPNWRIIGTMNVYDKSSLFNMSLAFMRRFAFIDVDLPEPRSYAKLRNKWIAKNNGFAAISAADRKSLKKKLNDLLDQTTPLMQRRALGPAIAQDMIKYVADRCPSKGAGESILDLLGEAFLLYAVPQLDGLDREGISEIYTHLSILFEQAARMKGILARIQVLYPYIPARDWKETPANLPAGGQNG